MVYDSLGRKMPFLSMLPLVNTSHQRLAYNKIPTLSNLIMTPQTRRCTRLRGPRQRKRPISSGLELVRLAGI